MSSKQNSVRKVAGALADLFSRVPRTDLMDTLRTADKQELRQAVEQELAQKKNRLEVAVVSARALSARIKEEIELWVEKKYRPRQVSIHYEINTALIGGIIIRTATEELDLSVSHKIDNLKFHV